MSMKQIKYPIPKVMSNPITKPEEKKKSKCRNKKVLIDGIWFDSQKEGNRYLELKQMEKAGLISNLRLQVKFELLPSYKIDNKTIRNINYVSDFVYNIQTADEEHPTLLKNRTIVEDVKPDTKKGKKPFRTEVYKLKKKMFEHKYKIKIKEV